MKHQKLWVLARLVRIVSAMVSVTAISAACDTVTQPSPIPSRVPAHPVTPSGSANPPSGPPCERSDGLVRADDHGIAKLRQCDRDGNGPDVSFPDPALVHRYDAIFTNGSATLTATDGRRNVINIGGEDTYYSPGVPLMTLKDGTLTIIVQPADGRSGVGSSSCELDGFSWYEVSTVDAFALCGTWRGSMADESRAEGSISGSFEYFVNNDFRSHLSCYATDHQFTLTLTRPAAR